MLSIEEINKLQKENEELKKELDLYKIWYRAKHNDIKNYLGRYYKALGEIEGYIKDPCEYCKPTSKCRECLGEGILNIINKAKEQ